MITFLIAGNHENPFKNFDLDLRNIEKRKSLTVVFSLLFKNQELFLRKRTECFFGGVQTHLDTRPCLSIARSVGRWVGWLVTLELENDKTIKITRNLSYKTRIFVIKFIIYVHDFHYKVIYESLTPVD